MLDEITYAFPNFNGVTIEFWGHIGCLPCVMHAYCSFNLKGNKNTPFHFRYVRLYFYNQLDIKVKLTWHYDEVIMGVMASQITSLAIVYPTIYSDTDQRKHQSSASLAFAWGIHRGPVNSPHKWSVTRKMFPFHDVIMDYYHWFPTWAHIEKGNTWEIFCRILIISLC